jgi:hypothetical protein
MSDSKMHAMGDPKALAATPAAACCGRCQAGKHLRQDDARHDDARHDDAWNKARGNPVLDLGWQGAAPA